MSKIRIGIVGYGNLGKGVKRALEQRNEMELVAVVTRRNPADLPIEESSIEKIHLDNIKSLQGKVDVMILCGGSATDLPVQGPAISAMFNTVDSFDTHAKIPEYFKAVDQAAKSTGKVAAISIGWDPGLFSMNRLLGEIVLPAGSGCSFWGKGVSQGHSDAIRRIKGVKNAVQYTIPLDNAVNAARIGKGTELTTREKHLRECYVVAEAGADTSLIEKQIKEMPNYFADYDVIVNFIDEAEMCKNHSSMPHGGLVIRSGLTGDNNKQAMEFSLNLDSNPEFTAGVLTAYAGGVMKFTQEGKVGAYTIFDFPLSYLSPKSGEELRRELL